MENDLSSAEVQTKIEILPWYAMTTSTCFGQNHTHSSPKSYPFIQKRYKIIHIRRYLRMDPGIYN